MTAKIGSLNVDVTLETARFKSGARQVRKEASGLEKSLNGIKKIGSAFAGAFLATGIGEIANAFRDMARESLAGASAIAKSAQLANAGAAEFQKVAYAAKAVGIDNEKLSDIFKDVNDKVGDFLETGGGPLKDFFDNIGPKVGVTAEQFKKLSGPQALQLYVSSLEKAGVNQQQLTFYMEALANDATALLPLLKDNGAAMKKLADDAEALGIVLSDQEVKDAVEAQAKYVQLQEVLAAKQAKVAVQNADAFLRYEEAIGNLKLAFINAVVGLEDANQRYNKWALGVNAELRRAINGAVEAATLIPAKLREMANSALVSLEKMLTGIKGAVVDRLNRICDSVTAKIDAVKRSFFDLYDAVVGHSYVPDMVDGIAAEMNRLDSAMVDPAAKATQKTAAGFRQMASEVQGILDRLFPQLADARRYAEETALITKGISDPTARDRALAALQREAAGLPTTGTSEIPISDELRQAGDTPLVKMGDGLDALVEKIGKLGQRSKATTVQVAKTFKDMADDTLAALSNMTSAIKGGGFLSILEGVIGLGLQLGSIGAFGSKIAANINRPRGYATGTSSAMSGLHWVGERGPELVNFRGGERVWNNRDSMAMGRARVEIIPSPYFDARVDGRAVAVAAPMAVRAAGAGSAGAQMSLARSRKRSMA